MPNITIEQKMRHAVLSQIPGKLWFTIFHNECDDRYLRVLEKPFDTITRNDLPPNQKQALILLILGHYENPIQYIAAARKVLSASDEDIFDIAVSFNRKDIRTKIIAQLVEHRDLILSHMRVEQQKEGFDPSQLQLKVKNLNDSIFKFHALENQLLVPVSVAECSVPSLSSRCSFIGPHNASLELVSFDKRLENSPATLTWR